MQIRISFDQSVEQLPLISPYPVSKANGKGCTDPSNTKPENPDSIPLLVTVSVVAKYKVYKDILEFHYIGEVHFFVGAVQVLPIRSQDHRRDPLPGEVVEIPLKHADQEVCHFFALFAPLSVDFRP